jgi:CBS domain-containing protein
MRRQTAAVMAAQSRRQIMKVAEVMTSNPLTIHCDESAYAAARMLADNDIGSLPVVEDDRLLGMVTDRDIVVRVVANHENPDEITLREIVSPEPKYCFEDEDVDHVVSNMNRLLIRRLPVMNREKRLVGIVSIDDLKPRKAA